MDSEEADYPELKIKEERLEKPQHECLACGKFISDRRNLVRHLRKIHCIEPIVRKPQLKCSFNEDCTFICATSEALREHLENAHEFNVEKKVLNFKTRGEFERWKQEEEQNTNARYVSYTGTKCRGNKKVYYLRCHRSGAVRPESNASQRKRVKPSKGYTQCGVTCPSSLRVAETVSGNIQVVYYPVHLGHSLDDESVQYMKLSTKEKEEIVGKLAQGEPVCKIVSDARKAKGAKLSRINLLQRRDVYNIKKKINYLEKESDHDGKQIDAWVKGLGLDPSRHNPLVLYKPIDENHDYDLILVHDAQKMIYTLVFDGSIVYVKTKKGKPNLDLNLVTLSVVCENGDAYPIAFCIAHKIEYITLYTFFKIVYQNVGTIRTQIFISDSVGQVYLAWKNVMGECENKLICTFGIESYWEQKLIALKCPVRKQKTATARLKVLLELADKDTFESELSKVLKEWEDDDDMKLFASFFQRFYVKKRFEWATCYRIHSTRKESINRYLEPINLVLQSIYEESYNSVANALNLLMSFVRDVCLLKVLQLSEEAATAKVAESERSHGEGLKMREVKSGSGRDWVVTEGGGEEYIVRSVESECDRSCGINCECCRICVHSASCSCADYVVGMKVCRHLHAVGIFSGETKDFVTMAVRHVAVSMVKSLAAQIESTTLSPEEYNKIIATVSCLRDDLKKKKLGEVVEASGNPPEAPMEL